MNIESNGTMSLETVHNGSMSKVDRYKWASGSSRGDLCWVHKSIPKIDPEYQRSANQSKIRGIARDFSWPAFGVALLARRGDDLYAMDAQHRILATRMRADITDIPAIVFDMASSAEEAKSFLQANTYRKALTAAEKYKAMVMTGKPEALIVEGLMKQHGRKIGDGAGCIRCIGALLKCAKEDEVVLDRTWPLLMDLSRTEPLTERVLMSLVYIEARLPAGTSLLHRKWSQRVLLLGANGLTEAAGKASAFYARGGESIWAKGVLEALNHKLSKNKLEMVEKSSAAKT